MRGHLRRRAILAAFALTAVLAPGLARAGKPCVTYSVTTPKADHGDTVCSPVSDPFTSTYSSRDCGGVPPAGTEFCVYTVIYVP